jgi:hypothetical protein
VLSTTYEKPDLAVVDPHSFDAVKKAIVSAFSSSHAADFFKSLSRAGLRVRDFENVLDQGLLGKDITAEYHRLGNGDQGQIREFYLASLEQVAPEIREKFFKLYAYY